MKKLISLMLCLLLAAAGFAAPAAADEPLKVVTTIFPPYDFIRQIAGDNVEVTMLLKPGSESHTFEPTPQDIITIQSCDLFIYVGGESDIWVDRILGSLDSGPKQVVMLTDMVETVQEEIVEGMEHEHEDHVHEEYDPDKVYDRPLSDWEGEWTSLAPFAADGTLDAYGETKIVDTDTTLAQWREKQAHTWRTEDFNTFSIQGDTMTLVKDGQSYSGTYRYAGYEAVEKESGVSVWYEYELTDAAEGMPAYLVFNDHGYGTAPEDHAEDDDDDDHEEEADEHADEDDDHGHEDEIAHTHLRYGDESFEALLTVEGWSPFFVDASAAPESYVGMLTGHSHSHEEEMDEHVWTSPKNAMAIVRSLTGTLKEMDPANAETYQANADAYLADLEAVDAALAEAVANAPNKTLIFGDRFPFRYFTDAYGLNYFAAFSGCSSQADASIATVLFLIDKVQSEKVPVVFKIELSNGNLAKTISESTGAQVLELHSAHNLSKEDFDNGVTYLDVMWRNVEQLKIALQ